MQRPTRRRTPTPTPIPIFVPELEELVAPEAEGLDVDDARAGVFVGLNILLCEEADIPAIGTDVDVIVWAVALVVDGETPTVDALIYSTTVGTDAVWSINVVVGVYPVTGVYEVGFISENQMVEPPTSVGRERMGWRTLGPAKAMTESS